LIAGTISLAALLVFRAKPSFDESLSEVDLAYSNAPSLDDVKETPMPPAYLPLLSFFGLGMILWSWAFIANLGHIPNANTVAAITMPRAALNGILGALGATVAAGLYSRLTTTQINPLMTARGAVAGLVIVSAAAPFIPPWQALAAGLIAGLSLPFLIYFIDHVLKLADHTASVASFGMMGVLAYLLVAFLADGQSGLGWNTVGPEGYLGVTGQGVSGLLVASGFAVDWPGQFNAQVIGVMTVMLWSFGIAFGLFRAVDWFSRPQTQAEEPEIQDEIRAEPVTK